MKLIILGTFLLILVKAFVDLIGKDVLSGKIYQWFLFITNNKDYKKLHSLKNQYKSINKQKNSISAQDQYSKWTKLNRQSDKLKKQIDQSEEVILVTQKSFISKSKIFLNVLILLPFWYMRIFYRNVAVTKIPQGLFPAPVEYYLSWPSFKKGIIGVGGWMVMVDMLLKSFIFIIKTLFFDDVVEEPKEVVEEIKIEEVN